MEYPSDASFTNVLVNGENRQEIIAINGVPLFLKDENGWYLNPDFFK